MSAAGRKHSSIAAGIEIDRLASFRPHAFAPGKSVADKR